MCFDSQQLVNNISLIKVTGLYYQSTVDMQLLVLKENPQSISHNGLPVNTSLHSCGVYSGIWALISVQVSTFASTATKFSRTIYLYDVPQLVNKIANVVSHDVVHRLHQSIPYFENWVCICGTCTNVISFMHLRKVSRPCTSFHGTHKSSAALFAEFLYLISPISDKKYGKYG